MKRQTKFFHILYVIISIMSSLCFHTTFSKISFDGLYSKLFSKTIDETVQKELALDDNTSLSIENVCGNITIKTEWKQNSIILKATKHVPKKENSKNIQIRMKKDPNTHTIAFRTVHLQDTTDTTECKDKTEKTDKKNSSKATTDYELIIPSNLIVNLKTQKGDIKIKRTNGSIQAETEKGEIKITESSGPINAVSHYGNIIIADSKGTIRATAKRGNIIIDGALQSIEAETEYGNIESICAQVPSIGSINLCTKSGNISLALPKSTNADIKANTKRGKLTSEHLITVKPQTVTLDKKTWKRFMQEVDGTLGSGEALIQLTSNKGNIKILKNNA